MPKVSIITPAYQVVEPKYVRTRESIERQTNKDFEWIIVSDGDSAYFPYWSDVQLKQNWGPSVARNVGFQISRGEIITYVDMGDALDVNRIENIISLHENYKPDLIFCAYNIVDASGVFCGVFNHFNFIGDDKFPTAVEYYHLLDRQNISIPLGVSHTRRPFVESGGFQPGIVCGEDGILWRRMKDHISPEKVLFSDSIAGTYYISNSGQSRTQRRFEMGGFAFDGSLNDNGRYLDADWYKNYTSEGYYE